MKILHVVPTYVPAWRHGGPIVATHGLCKALAARGHEVTVFTTNVHGDATLPVPLGEPVRMEGVEVVYFPVAWPRRLYRSPDMASALRQQAGRFDVLHLHSIFLCPTRYAARAAAAAGVPYVVAPRGMLVKDLLRRRGRLRKTLWLWLAERRTLARAAALHATSDLEAAEARRFRLRLPPIAIVPNGVDAEHLKVRDWHEVSAHVREAIEPGPFVLYLGRLSWKKGLDRLIDALTRVPDLVVLLAGPDEESLWPELFKRAETAGVADRLRYVGPVAGNDKAAVLRAAACLAMPSYSENFGNAVLEAMAAGCAVVVTPEVGLAALVEESGAGLVVAGDGEPLAAALSRLLHDTEERRAMGERGRAAAMRFDWPAVAARMEEVYTAARAGR